MAKRFAGEDAGGQIRDVENVPTSVLFDRQQDLARKPLNTEDGASETIMRVELDNRGVSVSNRIPMGVLARQFKAECERTGDPRVAWRSLCQRHGLGNVPPPAEMRAIAGLKPVAAGMGTYDDPAEDPRSPEEAGALASRHTAKRNWKCDSCGEWNDDIMRDDCEHCGQPVTGEEETRYVKASRRMAGGSGDFRVQVIADDSGQWAGNAMLYPTAEEAKEAALDLFSRWMLTREWRVVNRRTNEVPYQSSGASKYTEVYTKYPEDEEPEAPGFSNKGLYAGRTHTATRLVAEVRDEVDWNVSNVNIRKSGRHKEAGFYEPWLDDLPEMQQFNNDPSFNPDSEATAVCELCGAPNATLDEDTDEYVCANCRQQGAEIPAVASRRTADFDNPESQAQQVYYGIDLNDPGIEPMTLQRIERYFRDFGGSAVQIVHNGGDTVGVEFKNHPGSGVYYVPASALVRTNTVGASRGRSLPLGTTRRAGPDRNAPPDGGWQPPARDDIQQFDCSQCGAEVWTANPEQISSGLCQDCSTGGPFPLPDGTTGSRRQGWGSSYSRDPFWLTTKYSGECKQCHRPIARGEKAFYYPIGKRLLCDGPCGQAASADFEMGKADEDFMNMASRKTAGESPDMWTAWLTSGYPGTPEYQRYVCDRCYDDTFSGRTDWVGEAPKKIEVPVGSKCNVCGRGTMRAPDSGGEPWDRNSSRMAAGEPAGYAFDIGGGVAYACPQCKQSMLANFDPFDDDDPPDFYPVDEFKMMGTEQCEGCGEFLNTGNVRASRTASGEPVGYSYDIGGGVAYACPECKASAIPPDDEEPLDFYPLNPATMNGTERCEQCGKSLSGDDGPGGGVEASRKTTGSTTLDEAERMAVQGSESGEQPWLILQDMSNPDSYYACSQDDWTANKDGSLASFGIYDSLMNGMSVNRTDHPANGWLRSRNAASHPADPLADKWSHGNGMDCLQSGGDSGTATAGADPKTKKGIYYFPDSASASEWASQNGWPTDRIIEYDLGYAIQAGKSGNYAGPGETPREWGGTTTASYGDPDDDFMGGATSKACPSCGNSMPADPTGMFDALCPHCESESDMGAEPYQPPLGANCPTCGGDGVPLGGLGNLMHYRCRDCGMDFSQSATTASRTAAVSPGIIQEVFRQFSTMGNSAEDIASDCESDTASVTAYVKQLSPFPGQDQWTDEDTRSMGRRIRDGMMKGFEGAIYSSRVTAGTSLDLATNSAIVRSAEMGEPFVVLDDPDTGGYRVARLEVWELQKGNTLSTCRFVAAYENGAEMQRAASRREAYTPSYQDDDLMSDRMDADIMQNQFEDAGRNIDRRYKKFKQLLQSGDVNGAAEMCPHGAGYLLNSPAAETENDPAKGQSGYRCTNCGSRVDDLHGGDLATVIAPCEIKGRWASRTAGPDPVWTPEKIDQRDKDDQPARDKWKSMNPDASSATSTAANSMSYEQWEKAVDDACYRQAGLSMWDLADCPYMDWYEDGVKPEAAAKRAIKRDGGGLEGARRTAKGDPDFDSAYRELASQGKVDGFGGSEYRTHYQEWLDAGSPEPAKRFILQNSGQDPDDGTMASRTAGWDSAKGEWEKPEPYDDDEWETRPDCPQCGRGGFYVPGTDNKVFDCKHCGQVQVPTTASRTAATGEFADFGTWKGLVLDCVRDSGGNDTLIEQYTDGELEDWYEGGMGVQEAADKITEDDYGYEASRTASNDPICPECNGPGQFVQGTDQILNCPSCGQVRMPLTEEQKHQHDWLDPHIEEQKNFKWSGEPMIPEGGWHA